MITVNERPQLLETGRYLISFFGNSEDKKPIKQYDGMLIGNGSTFFTINTADVAFYDEEHDKWRTGSSSSSGGSGDTPQGEDMTLEVGNVTTGETAKVNVRQSDDTYYLDVQFPECNATWEDDPSVKQS